MINFTAPRLLERGHAYPQGRVGAFYLTAASNWVQTNRAAAKSADGKLTARSGAAISRKQAFGGFFYARDLSFMAGRAGKPKGLPVLHRSVNPVSVCRLFDSRMAVTTPLLEQGI